MDNQKHLMPQDLAYFVGRICHKTENINRTLKDYLEIIHRRLKIPISVRSMISEYVTYESVEELFADGYENIYIEVVIEYNNGSNYVDPCSAAEDIADLLVKEFEKDGLIVKKYESGNCFYVMANYSGMFN